MRKRLPASGRFRRRLVIRHQDPASDWGLRTGDCVSMTDDAPRKLKIRWAPKVRPERLRQLYEQDARGIVDKRLIDDVGLALYLRCESIVLASTGRVKCAVCGEIVPVKTPRVETSAEQVVRCERCGWETTVGEW